MNRARKRYTREEDEAIFRAVKDSASLNTCFIAVAQELGRTPQGVANRWYTALSNPEHPNYMGTAMILMKEHRAGINRTNTDKFPVEVKESWWKRILNIFKL